MINEALYNKTIEILVQAYFNDTLEHHNCYACAVGNLVAANMGLGFQQATDDPRKVWSSTPAYYNQNSIWYNYINKYRREGLDADKGALNQIEEAFEFGFDRYNSNDEMFDGLIAVIDVLDKIHENTDKELSAVQKKRFNKSCAIPAI